MTGMWKRTIATVALLLGVVALTTALDGRRDAATSTTVGLQTVATPPPLTEPATD